MIIQTAHIKENKIDFSPGTALWFYPALALFFHYKVHYKRNDCALLTEDEVLGV